MIFQRVVIYGATISTGEFLTPDEMVVFLHDVYNMPMNSADEIVKKCISNDNDKDLIFYTGSTDNDQQCCITFSSSLHDIHIVFLNEHNRRKETWHLLDYVYYLLFNYDEA